MTNINDALPSQYTPAENEAPLYQWWWKHGFFRADPASERDPYTIVIPPPNVTAVLHMGHGLNNTIQDVLIRWRRMQGREALWMPGTDHAGIATQNVVERRLAGAGSSRFDLGREAFVGEVWEYVRETGSTILDQLRSIGCSCDWDRTRFTLDEGLSAAVREVFVRLYEKDLIYRGTRIINWCPRCLTALSDEEAEQEETAGKLYHLRYPLASGSAADGRDYLVVATTRPETMLGDVAVAVHPSDRRYGALVGAEVELPLAGRRIPIVADEFVDPDFGSGAVKVTPAHDPNDFEIGRRHGLPEIDVMTPEATMNVAAPEAFRGLDRFEARGAVVQALRELGLVDKVEEHAHSVPHCYRCHTVVEPRLSEQWFVRMESLARPALEASRHGRVRFTPERWTRVYEHWLENIRDWCISRQLWWGHRIPVWYCRAEGCERTIVSRTDPDSCPGCGSSELVQDPDVLDTWFSSWLWPFSTLGWPQQTPELSRFYPTNTLVTAPEILFFWVARMIMSGIEFMGREPFTDVYLHGTVRDHLGRKMSKSLGNGIDPLDVVGTYGADALRYTLVSGMGVGTDLLLNYEDLETTFAPGRNFANKLWNAGRFALMNIGDGEVPSLDAVAEHQEFADRWILSRLSRATREITTALERFRLNDAALAGHAFFWGELADWYLEMVKPRLRGESGEASRDAARATLVTVLDGTLRLLHPVIPFITETVWQRLPGRNAESESLMVSRWPEPVAAWEDADVEARVQELKEAVAAVRNFRAEYGVQPAQRLTVRLAGDADALGFLSGAARGAFRDLARLEEVQEGRADGNVGATAVLRCGLELFVPLEGVIDVDRERARLREDVARADRLLDGTRARLGNEKFVSRAPADVIQREREKLTGIEEQREKLLRTLSSLGGAA
jgi:valyl-tRNA synthetase